MVQRVALVVETEADPLAVAVELEQRGVGLLNHLALVYLHAQ